MFIQPFITKAISPLKPFSQHITLNTLNIYVLYPIHLLRSNYVSIIGETTSKEMALQPNNKLLSRSKYTIETFLLPTNIDIFLTKERNHQSPQICSLSQLLHALCKEVMEEKNEVGVLKSQPYNFWQLEKEERDFNKWNKQCGDTSWPFGFGSTHFLKNNTCFFLLAVCCQVFYIIT